MIFRATFLYIYFFFAKRVSFSSLKNVYAKNKIDEFRTHGKVDQSSDHLIMSDIKRVNL